MRQFTSQPRNIRCVATQRLRISNLTIAVIKKSRVNILCLFRRAAGRSLAREQRYNCNRVTIVNGDSVLLQSHH